MTSSSTTADPPTCPCCNNPWAAATGELFAKLCEDCEASSPNNKAAATADDSLSLRSHMDFSVPPGTNFFQYAAGTWMKNNPLPAGYPSWNTFTALHVQSQEHLKALLEEIIRKKNAEDAVTDDEAKVAAFYGAALDEDAIEAAGLAPLQPVLDLIDETAAATAASPSSSSTDENHRVAANTAKLLGQFPAKFGLFPFFRLSASPDHRHSAHTLCQISQGGLGLPDRDYYFDPDKADKRDAYVDHMARMLTLLRQKESISSEDNNDPSAAAAAAATIVVTEETKAVAQKVYELEVRLAEAHMTKTENRDPDKTYNKMSIQALSDETCHRQFDFAAYLRSSCPGKEELGDVNVRNVAALESVAAVIHSCCCSTGDDDDRAEILRAYLQWTAVRSLAPYLSKVFVQEHFDFYEKCLSGTTELKPRWKRVMAFTEHALGEVLGQLYCARHFDESCKARAVAIVERVRQALEARLREVDWIRAASTRENALQKMAAFRVKIGYPDKWIDYSSLQIVSPDSDNDNSFLSMVFRAEAFDHRRTVDEMNAPTDRQKWFMTPQTVNAYYHPSLNEIVFPAAILQPPFFHPDADDALNYGAMGEFTRFLCVVIASLALFVVTHSHTWLFCLLLLLAFLLSLSF